MQAGYAQVIEGNALYFDDDFNGALAMFTQAIAAAPKNADYFAHRAQVHIKMNNLTGAPCRRACPPQPPSPLRTRGGQSACLPRAQPLQHRPSLLLCVAVTLCAAVSVFLAVPGDVEFSLDALAIIAHTTHRCHRRRQRSNQAGWQQRQSALPQRVRLYYACTASVCRVSQSVHFSFLRLTNPECSRRRFAYSAAFLQRGMFHTGRIPHCHEELSEVLVTGGGHKSSQNVGPQV